MEFRRRRTPRLRPDRELHVSESGTYNASLRVIDNMGLASSTPVTIVVTAPLTADQKSRVGSINLTARKFKNGNIDALSNVYVTDTSGNPVAGATVKGAWSGKVTGSGSAITGSNGVASIKASRTNGSGSITFTVTDVTGAAYVYDPALNVESVDTVSF